jgi:hypothetical protein
MKKLFDLRIAFGHWLWTSRVTWLHFAEPLFAPENLTGRLTSSVVFPLASNIDKGHHSLDAPQFVATQPIIDLVNATIDNVNAATELEHFRHEGKASQPTEAVEASCDFGCAFHNDQVSGPQ